jgi:hypothetical protein
MVAGLMQDFGVLSTDSIYTETSNGRKSITYDLTSSPNGWTPVDEASSHTFIVDTFNNPKLVSFTKHLFCFCFSSLEQIAKQKQSLI